MKHLRLALVFGLMLSFSSYGFAQILDDEEAVDSAEANVLVEEKEDHEELFDEMFADKIKNDEDSKINTLNKLAEDAVKHIEVKKTANTKSYEEMKAIPTEGELKIGVSKDSFKLTQDMLGRTVCTFGVTLESTLNKEIKTLALRLVYAETAFAFVFRDVKANGADERYISTRGDICYNLTGVPDIDINRCRIFGANDDECAKRIKWEEGILSPNPEKNPYL